MDQLDSMIVSKDFAGILGRLRNEPHADVDDSLVFGCLDIARAVYKEAKGPAANLDLCLAILQTMIKLGWGWSSRDDVIHLLLPLHRQLIRLGIDPVDRNKYYQCTKGIEAAIDKGDRLTEADLLSSCG